MLTYYRNEVCSICNIKFADDYNGLMEAINPIHHKRCILNITPHEVIQLLKDGKVREALQKTYPNQLFKVNDLYEYKSDYVYSSLIRTGWVNHFYCWHLMPTYEQMLEIKEFIADSLAIEVGAGKGMFAAFLKALDINVIASDPHCYDEFTGYSMLSNANALRNADNSVYTEILNYDINEMLNKYGSTADVLISCWGSYNICEESCAKFKGNKVIIIGEAIGGCTACGYLQTICEEEKGWKLYKKIKIPIFDAIHDACYLYLKN